MLKKILTYCIVAMAAIDAYAQDIHFSNFYTNTLNLNPADAGFFTGHYRFCLAYRDQYRTVAKPYQTVTANFDGKVAKRGWNFILGYGALLNMDVAGDANYNTVQFGIPFAQHFKLVSNTVIISYGILPAIHYCSFDYANLTFGEQFEGMKYNPDAEITEALDMNEVTYFDLNAGVMGTFKPRKNQTYTIGVAMYNINQPDISFYDNDIPLPHRFLVHGSGIISPTSNIDVIPGFKMQFQGKQHEFHFGLMGISYFDGSAVSQVQYGAWFRSKNKDAVIFGIGCRYSGFDIMFNYDLNISSLKTASNGHGAAEITLSYIVENNNKSKRMAAVRCPHTL
mgnify:CR=1 FL=1